MPINGLNIFNPATYYQTDAPQAQASAQAPEQTAQTARGNEGRSTASSNNTAPASSTLQRLRSMLWRGNSTAAPRTGAAQTRTSEEAMPSTLRNEDKALAAWLQKVGDEMVRKSDKVREMTR